MAHPSGAWPKAEVYRISQAEDGSAAFHWAEIGNEHSRGRSLFRDEGHDWRWPAAVPAAAPAASDVAASGNVAVQTRSEFAPPPSPESFRRCPVAIADPDDPGRVCATVLGFDLVCSVCGGQRCALHCQAVDHYAGAQTIVDLVVCPPSSHRREYGIKLVRWGAEFIGDARSVRPAALMVFATRRGDNGDRVLKDLYAVVDALATSEPPHRERYVPPTVERISDDLRGPLFGAPERAPETPAAADGFDPDRWHGITPHDLARALPALRLRRGPSATKRDLEALILDINHLWGELEERAVDDPQPISVESTVTRARALSDAFACELISLLAGGLR